MKNPTYQTYLADPELRARLEREARRARARAMYHYLIAPLVRFAGRMARRSAPIARLKRGGTLKLERGRGTEVQVIDGNVWLTQHQDNADYVMHPGDRVVLNGRGTTFIYAFDDASLRLAA